MRTEARVWFLSSIATGFAHVYNVAFSSFSQGICLLDNLECSSSSWVNREWRKYSSVKPNICPGRMKILKHVELIAYIIFHAIQHTYKIISVNTSQSEYWYYSCALFETRLIEKHAAEIKICKTVTRLLYVHSVLLFGLLLRMNCCEGTTVCHVTYYLTVMCNYRKMALLKYITLYFSSSQLFSSDSEVALVIRFVIWFLFSPPSWSGLVLEPVQNLYSFAFP